MPIVDLIKGIALGSGVDIGGQVFGDSVVRTPPDQFGEPR